MFLTSITVASLLAVTQAQANVPWDNLRSSLTDPSALKPGGFGPWREECVLPMAEAFINNMGGIAFGPSNYQFIADPTGGQCMVFGQSCAYWNCEWPYLNSTDLKAMVNEGTELSPELLNLPSYVIFPKTAGDIVNAINFATENNVPVKVKSTGHAHSGDSTGRDALLINMRSYPRYVDPDAEDKGLSTIVECDGGNNGDPAHAMACTLAQARDVKAYMRVGGGQIFDEVLRTLANWNNVEGNNQYHIISGASGTVGTSGGWLMGGGLGMTQAGRHFGFGVDQVLLLEMVLPSGQHVRFGPTEWSWEEAKTKGLLQPTTTKVTGYCNNNTEATNEAEWEWMDCPEDSKPNFADLWFVLRGGSGGFGVVTSVYYQLPDRPGDMDAVLMHPLSDEWVEALTPVWVDFYLDFFVEPGKLQNVTEENSNMCGSYVQQHSFKSPAKQQQLFFCFNGAGQVLASAWKGYVLSHTDDLMAAGLSQEEVTQVSNNITVFTYSSYADFSLNLPEELFWLRNPSNPEGRASDLVPGVFVDRGQDGLMMYQVPRSLFVKKREEMASFLKGLESRGTTYMMGGNHKISHDQMTSMPSASRESAFLLNLPSYEEKAQLFQIMFGDMEQGENFPGLFCFNIALVNDIGPLKDDWTKPCNTSWSKAEQQDKCVSFQEATWGTDLLKRLEDIKRTVDPKLLFVAEYGILGNSGVKKDMEAPGDVGANFTKEQSEDPAPSENLEETKVSESGDQPPESAAASACILQLAIFPLALMLASYL